jgi:hypothetical protein
MHEIIPPIPQYAFMAWCSVKKKYRDNFTFILQSLIYSRNFLHFMESEVSLLCSQESSIGAYFKALESVSHYTTYLPKTHFSIILHLPIKTLFAFVICPVRTDCIARFIMNHINISNLLLLPFLSLSLRFLYPPPHPFSCFLNLCSLLRVTHQVSHPYKTTGKILVLYISIFMYSDRKEDAKGF